MSKKSKELAAALAANPGVPIAAAIAAAALAATVEGKKTMRAASDLMRLGSEGLKRQAAETAAKAADIAARAEESLRAHQLRVAEAARPEAARIEINAPVSAPTFEAPTFEAPVFQAPPAFVLPPAFALPPGPTEPEVLAPPPPPRMTWGPFMEDAGIPVHLRDAVGSALNRLPCARPRGKGLMPEFSSRGCAEDFGDTIALVAAEAAERALEALEAGVRSAALQPELYIAALDAAAARIRSKVLGTNIDSERRRQADSVLLEPIREIARAVARTPDNLGKLGADTRDFIIRTGSTMWRNAKMGRWLG